MAIYHLSASIVKRSAGRSVTAAAAYRAGCKIEDLTTGIVHDYTRKQGVDYSAILSPISSDAIGDEWLLDREQLWNKVEQVEKRKDAQLSREVTIALPRELSRPEQIALVLEFVQTNYVAAGMIADLNLHYLNGDNPHAHILLSMRDLKTSPDGVVEFGLKNTSWNEKELLINHRKSWESITNKYLEMAGSNARIDCRSLQDQGSQFIPQIHVGVHATAMKRKGIATDRSEEFDRIKAANNDIRDQLEQIYKQESALYEKENNEIKERDHKLAELIIEAIKHNPSPRCEWEAIRAKKGISRDHARFDCKDSTSCYSVILNKKHNIEVRISGARPQLFTFEKEDNKWIKKTFYHKTAFRVITSPNEFWKERIDKAVEDFDESTVDNYYNKLEQVRLKDKRLQLKEYELGKLIINLSKELQNKYLRIEHLAILVEENVISILDRRSLPHASALELTNDGCNNFSRNYIRRDVDETSQINYLTEIVTNYQNELKPKLVIENVEIVVAEQELISLNFLEKVDPNNRPPALKSSDGNPLNHIRNALTIAVEKEPKPTAVQTSTVVPILIPSDLELPQSTEIIVAIPDLPIIKLDPVDINLEPITALIDKEVIEQQDKPDEEKPENKQPYIQNKKQPQRKKSRGYEI